MSTYRKNDGASQERCQSPQSPSGRARDPNYEFDLDTSHFPNPLKKQYAPRPRHNFRTGTLAGAYHAASRAVMADEPILGSAPVRRHMRETTNVLFPSETSSPPEELADVYRRIEEDGTLANAVSFDEWDKQPGTRPGSRMSRSSSRASKTREHHTTESQDGLTSPEADSRDGFVAHSPRRRTTDYTKDELRLRRVTGKDSPVFSKAKIGTRAALTSENLQRREDEGQSEHISEDDGEYRPSLNLPSNWGTRANRQQELLRNVSQGTMSEPQGDKLETTKSIQLKTRIDDIATSNPIRFSPRWQNGSRVPTRNALGERTANLHAQDSEEIKAHKSEEKPEDDHNVQSGEGARIPNTPITVFKNSAPTKPSPTKRDSQELLRKLSRTESPKLNQHHTPETPDPPTLFNRRIHDKTPRVTGAWIDTPMTERVTELPDDLTNNIVSRSELSKESSQQTEEEKLTVKIESKPQATYPARNIAADAKQQEKQPIKRSMLPLIRPKLPKSGLATVIEDASSGTLDLGDDTIESLQAIMEDQTEVKSDDEESATYESKMLAKAASAHAGEEEPVDFVRLEGKLQSLMWHMKELKEGLYSLERHVNRGSTVMSQSSSPTEKDHQNLQSLTTYACQNCAAHSNGRVYATIALPRLWTRNPISRRLQFTKLGWFLLISLTWYIVECMMCEEYSHPSISETCDKYCLEPNAPYFPWVTVTMLWRWSHLSVLLAPIMASCVVAFRFAAQLLGLQDGYIDEPAQLGNIVGEIRINGTPVSFPWLSSPSDNTAQPPSVWTPRAEVPTMWEDDQVSMEDDEYL